MPKLLLKMQVSLDGYVGAPDGDIAWVFDSLDDELRAYEVALLSGAGAHLMGRATYEDMAAHWPTADSPFAEPMNTIPKVVFSNTLSEASWGSTTVLSGPLAEEIATLKAAPGDRPLIAHGGARFAQALSRAGLIDEYHLIVHPAVLGDGLSLFGGRADLTMCDVRRFPAGALALTYLRAEAG